MKLFFCPKCQDIIKLTEHLRFCACGECYGRYTDDTHTVVSSEAIPLGILNFSFMKAIKERPSEGLGSRFEAVVIPVKCETVTVQKYCKRF
jgi:hypothetical protein